MALLTIGYGSRPLDVFCELVGSWRPDFIVDVRSVPYSRFRPEYGRHLLAGHLARMSIRYAFLGHLLGGRPHDPVLYTDGYVDYQKVAASEPFVTGMARLQDAEAKGISCMLMCSEEKPEDCHRAKLIGEQWVRGGFEIVHIDERGELLDQASVIERLTQGQRDLFPGKFLSRKPYRPIIE